MVHAPDKGQSHTLTGILIRVSLSRVRNMVKVFLLKKMVISMRGIFRRIIKMVRGGWNGSMVGFIPGNGRMISFMALAR